MLSNRAIGSPAEATFNVAGRVSPVPRWQAPACEGWAPRSGYRAVIAGSLENLLKIKISSKLYMAPRSYRRKRRKLANRLNRRAQRLVKRHRMGALGAQPSTSLIRINKTLPDRMRFKTTYAEDIGIVIGGAGLPGRYEFRMNSVYDPNFTGQGDSAVGMEEWARFYNKYRVYASKITVTPKFSENTTASLYRRCAILASGPLHSSGIVPPAPLTDWNGIIEQPYTKHKNFLVYSNWNSSLSMYCTVQSIMGETRNNMGSVNYEGLTGDTGVGANPPRTTFWQIYSQAQDYTATIAHAYNVKIVYYCELFDRKILDRSFGGAGELGTTGPTGGNDTSSYPSYPF